MKWLAFEARYTRSDLASELDISIATINQWWSGDTRLAKPESVERLKKFLIRCGL